MSFSGIATKENATSPELRGMKYKELPRLFIFLGLKKFSKN